jgi:hypothetical protein
MSRLVGLWLVGCALFVTPVAADELHGGGLLRPQRPKWNQKTDDTYTIGVDGCLPSASMCVL